MGLENIYTLVTREDGLLNVDLKILRRVVS